MTIDRRVQQEGDTVDAWLGRVDGAPELRRIVTMLRGAAGGGCVTPDADTVAGWIEPKSSLEAVARLDAEPALRRQIAVAGRLRPGAPSRRAVWIGNRRGAAGALAAVLAVVALVPWWNGRPAVDPHRALPVAPARWELRERLVGAGAVLEWRAVPGVDEYRVEVTDGSGRLLYGARTPDTALAIAPGALAPGGRYFARIRARLDLERWAESEFVELAVP